MDSVIPLGLYKQTNFSEVVAGVVASVGYLGASAFLTINNNGKTVGVIPERALLVSTNQVYEIVIEKYSGAALATPIYYRHQYGEANVSTCVKIPELILKPGEILIVRVFNRAPAAVSAVGLGVTYYEIDAALYDQLITKLRDNFEREAGV